MKKIIIRMFLIVLTLGMIGCTVPVPPSPFEPSCIGDIFDYGYENVSLDEAKGCKISIDRLKEETFYNEFKHLKVTIAESIDKLEETIIHKIYFHDASFNKNHYINFYGQEEDIEYAKVWFQGSIYDIETNVELFDTLIKYLLNQVPEENHFLRNQLGCEWLKELEVEDIKKIKTITEYVGVAPGSFKDINSSIDNNVIRNILEKYYWLDTTPIYGEDAMYVPGGTNYITQFIMNDGTIKELEINNGVYYDNEGGFFKLKYVPKFSENDEYESSYGFITYQDTFELYTLDGLRLGSFSGLSEYEFIKYPYDYIEDNEDLGYIETEFGRLYIHSENIFYMKENNIHTYYLVVGEKNFNDIFSGN